MARTSKGALNVDLTNVDQSELEKMKININDEIGKATDLLNNFSDIHVNKIKANFIDNEWIFKSTINKRVSNFDFLSIANIIKFTEIQNKELFLNAIKCWIANLLSENTIEVAKRYFQDIYSAIYATSGFNSDSIYDFIELLESHNIYRLNIKKVFQIVFLEDSSLREYIRHIKIFLNYYNGENCMDYIKSIAKVYGKLKVKRKNREIPSASDVLKFEKYIDDWYERIIPNKSKKNILELIRFYPVYLWWEITSIIPMRPTEFCLIKRNCTSNKEGSFYLTFPRIKHKRKGKSREVDYYDILPIPERIYNLINHYICLTEGYGTTEYLISFKSFLHVNRAVFGIEANTGSRIEYKNNEILFRTNLGDINYNNDDIFSVNHLLETIGKFYRDIIHGGYKVNIFNISGEFKRVLQGEQLIEADSIETIERMLLPGDLRHIAILNMMLQGYDPVKITRLAGQISNETKFSYENHMQFWIDSQIHKLATDFANSNFSAINEYSGNKDSLLHPSAIVWSKWFERKVLFINKFDINLPETQKLSIGYCKEQDMPCPTFNYKHRGCYFCNHWVISIEELAIHRNYILKDLSRLYDELKDKVIFLKSLLNVHLNQFKDVDIENKREQITTANEIKDSTINISKLIGMLGVNQNYE